MKNISKGFPGVQALDKVDFSCDLGEIHALVGENGAGKSTLIKILSGVYHPDEGTVSIRGKEVSFPNPRKAQEAGISTIYQEFNLISDLNVAANIFLGRELKKGLGIIKTNDMYQQAKELLDVLGSRIDVRMKVKKLTVAEQQMVEVAKALSLNADIIIMDEPSAVISGKELNSLFRVIRSLRETGKAIIYISHRLDEVFRITDRVTVLKDGKLVGTLKTQEADKPQIIKMMVGRSLSETFPAKVEKKGYERKEVLSLKNVSHGKTFRNVSFSVYTGEVLGLSGLVGSGRTGLARAIFGAESIDDGEIHFDGQLIKKFTPKASIFRGVGFVTEDRKKEGLVGGMSVRENLTLIILDRINRMGFIKKHEEKAIAEDCVKQFEITPPDVEREIQFLSGGNQQKAIVAKWINADLKLIILDEPTRGIDVGTKGEVYKLIRQLAEQGKAVIMISSELPEVIGMSDRILVMHEGHVMGEISGTEATEEHIIAMATGHNTVGELEKEQSLES